MSLFNEIIGWSKGRPMWQRDALRRIATTGAVGPADLDGLVEMAAAAARSTTRVRRSRRWQKPATATTPIPIDPAHVPVIDAQGEAVSLIAVEKPHNVNALDPSAVLTFGRTGLTVVYGRNGSGKTGYARILKHSCRCRAPEAPILGNVMAGTNGSKTAVIRYAVGTVESEWLWSSDAAAPDELARVAVFDSHSARVHVNDSTSLSFAPLGLEVLTHLADVCQLVRDRLTSACSVLQSGSRTWPHLEVGEVAVALSRLGTSRGLDEVESLAHLTDAEEAHRRALPELIAQAITTDVTRRAREASLRADQFGSLARVATSSAELLSDQSLRELRQATAELDAARQLVEAAAENDFASEPLPGIGAAAWSALWEAAKQYSESAAYELHEFPYLDEDARCVLCQQPLDEEGLDRLRRFRDFVAAEAATRVTVAQGVLDAKCDAMRRVGAQTRLLAEIASLRAADDDFGRLVEVILDKSYAVFEGLAQDPRGAQLERTICESLVDVARELTTRSAQEAQDAAALRALDGQANDVPRLQAELELLEARCALAAVLPDVLDEHDRRVEISVLSEAAKSCHTAAITRKAAEVATDNVETLGSIFASEIERLGLDAVSVSMSSDGSKRGVPYVRVSLAKVAQRIKPEDVLSEGEQRVVALAAFLAELSMGGDRSALVFDDPVSSLDHRYRANVAARLVEEASRRQVIVLTHDSIFVNNIHDAVQERVLEERAVGAAVAEPVKLISRHIVRSAAGTGCVTDELGWRSVRVKDRLNALDDEVRAAAQIYATGDEAAYESAARQILARLREAWERAVEEVLLKEIIQRGAPAVQTNLLRYLTDITDSDVATVSRGMTVESRFMEGHDEPLGEDRPVPGHQWLRAEIDRLRSWVGEINKRRK